MNIARIATFAQPSADEAELVKRAKARDASVWSMWHDQHYPFVYRYALSRLASVAEAEDIASQVFLEAIKGIDRYRYQGRPILAWFYGIAHNLVSRRFRQSRRTTSLSQLAPRDEPIDAGMDDVVVERLSLTTALAKLKPEHSEVLTLRFLLELKTAEVAGLLGKSEAATYSLQVRAAAALRRELEK